MSLLGSDLSIAVRVSQYKNSKEVIKIVRSYSDKSIVQISIALKNGENIFEIKLVKEKFYDGWKILYSLVDALIAADTRVSILVNGQLVDLAFNQQLKEKMTNIKREDIY